MKFLHLAYPWTVLSCDLGYSRCSLFDSSVLQLYCTSYAVRSAFLVTASVLVINVQCMWTCEDFSWWCMLPLWPSECLTSIGCHFELTICCDGCRNGNSRCWHCAVHYWFATYSRATRLCSLLIKVPWTPTFTSHTADVCYTGSLCVNMNLTFIMAVYLKCIVCI